MNPLNIIVLAALAARSRLTKSLCRLFLFINIAGFLTLMVVPQYIEPSAFLLLGMVIVSCWYFAYQRV